MVDADHSPSRELWRRMGFPPSPLHLEAQLGSPKPARRAPSLELVTVVESRDERTAGMAIDELPPAASRSAVDMSLREAPWLEVARLAVVHRLVNMTFYQLHVMLFFVVGLLGALAIFLVELGASKMSFVDAVFTSYSALCVTGLISVDFSRVGRAAQIITLLLIFLGGSVLGSLIPPLMQQHALRKYPRRVMRELHPSVALSTESVRIPSQLPSADALNLQLRYTAVSWAMRFILLYLAGFLSLAFLLFGIFLSASEFGQLASDANGVHAWWFALFHSLSGFRAAKLRGANA